MDFKIDTRDTFTAITPVATEISGILSESLHNTVHKMRQSGSPNFIIDLQNGLSIAPEAIDKLVQLHEECYEAGCSLVLTAIKSPVLAAIKESGADEILNIAPQMIEAIDIVSMEILERDLFNEEE